MPKFPSQKHNLMKKAYLILFTLTLALTLSQAQNLQKELQTAMIMAEDGDVIEVPEGNFHFDGTLSMDEKKNITIKGAGKDKSIISFKGQTKGAEGLRITNSENIKVVGLTIQDAKGDAIKAMEVKGISFIDVRTEWTGKPKATNGAYGLYPVSCENVLIDKCEAIGASDAGIYVGQSHNIIVRNTRAYQNVAGIEIENSTQAEVYECVAEGNTGGILVFDLPDLPKKKGGDVRVFNNYVHHNNYKNFAPEGNTVAQIPPGTGIMVLATSDVEVFDNRIQDNRTIGMTVISYYMTERKIKDKEYDPYPKAIYIHDNSYEQSKNWRPTFKSKIGLLLYQKFKKDVPDIVYDGILDETTLDEDGNVMDQYKICIQESEGTTYGNIDAANGFKNIQRDITVHNCELEPLAKPDLEEK